MDKTTIQVNLDTLERLKNLRKFERQSYDDVLNNIFDGLEEETLEDEEIEEIKIGLEDVREGRVKSIEQVAKEMGIVLK